MMDAVALILGKVMLTVGGALLGGWFLVLLGQILCNAYVELRRKTRLIAEEEAMICEYCKNRDKFMEWKEGKGHG